MHVEIYQNSYDLNLPLYIRTTWHDFKMAGDKVSRWSAYRIKRSLVRIRKYGRRLFIVERQPRLCRSAA